MQILSLVHLVIVSAFVVSSASTVLKPVIIPSSHPQIYFHGRWDDSPGTWWYVTSHSLCQHWLHALTLLTKGWILIQTLRRESPNSIFEFGTTYDRPVRINRRLLGLPVFLPSQCICWREHHSARGCQKHRQQ